jgi:predicted MarR family transcription regulator
VATRKYEQPDGRTAEIDRTWHLATDPFEISATDLEYALMRTFEAFGRWQAECLASVADIQASGPENAILHIIRMHGRPKSIRDIARLTNREDIPNIQYSLRKLNKAGLIRRTGSGRSGVTYAVTEEGLRITDAFAHSRKSLLISMLKELHHSGDKLRQAASTLELIGGIYEQAARIASTHRR